MKEPSRAESDKEETKDILEMTEAMLTNARAEIDEEKCISIPIGQLSGLGAAVASLIPQLRTVTTKTTVNTDGLYELVNFNSKAGDTLKKAKNGNYVGAFKNSDGKSKILQLKEAEPIKPITQTTTMPINPATIMMAAALFSIEKQLGEIEETQKRILNFLEIEKESEIEADVETLSELIKKYKYNWDNDSFITSNHNIVLNIKRTALKHMNSYRKKVKDILNTNNAIVSQMTVSSELKNLKKTFEYYRLSLYAYSLASFVEIMFNGNFSEGYISAIEKEVEDHAITYREFYSKCYDYLKGINSASVETNVLKGIGDAGKALGNFIGSIPWIKEGPVDEFFQDMGKQLRKNADDIENKAIESFSEYSNPNTKVFVDKMEDIIQIYNHTSQICFDKNKIYLITDLVTS